MNLIESLQTEFAASESDLTQLDQSILAKAFRGELVPQDPSDEPASVLLERIRKTRAAAEEPPPAATKSRRSHRKITAIRVLSVRQPWADHLLYGEKWCENRSWNTPYRGPLYLHASSWEKGQQASPGAGITGAILGCVELVDVVDLAEIGETGVRRVARRHQLSTGRAAMVHVVGEKCWIVTRPRLLKAPIPTKGQLHIWSLEVDADCLQLADSPATNGPSKIATQPRAARNGALTSNLSRQSAEQGDSDEIVAHFRATFWGNGEQTEDELLRAVADRLGYGRLSSKRRDELKGHLRTAIRRQAVARNGNLLTCPTSIFRNYDQDFLLKKLHSVMRPGREYERTEVARNLAHYLGYRTISGGMKKQLNPDYSLVSGKRDRTIA